MHRIVPIFSIFAPCKLVIVRMEKQSVNEIEFSEDFGGVRRINKNLANK
jgi:hypothetical protein